MIPNPQAKKILCYGDSNTWGQNPHIRSGRFAADERWTGIVQLRLGEVFAIIEEGLSSRTTDVDYNQKSGRNGKVYFQPCLESQSPLDLVVIMLGTNDMKIEFGPRSATDIAEALRGYVEFMKEHAKAPDDTAPRVALVSPVHIDVTAPTFTKWYTEKYDDRGAVTSRQLAAEIQTVADDTGSFFFDAAQVALPGEDGIHMNMEGHKALGSALAIKIMGWLE
jgi:lysophospholipase L1-like esterase